VVLKIERVYEPVVAAKVPGLQKEQSLRPTVGAAVPNSHALHVDRPTLFCEYLREVRSRDREIER
jgi:hypothetical protein